MVGRENGLQDIGWNGVQYILPSFQTDPFTDSIHVHGLLRPTAILGEVF